MSYFSRKPSYHNRLLWNTLGQKIVRINSLTILLKFHTPQSMSLIHSVLNNTYVKNPTCWTHIELSGEQPVLACVQRVTQAVPVGNTEPALI